MRHLPSYFLSLLLFACHGLYAQPTDKDQPIQLAADSVDVDEGTGISLYQGNVDLRQGNMQMLADKVRIKYQGRQPKKIFAYGKPVHFTQKTDEGLVAAQALRAEYIVNSDFLTLIDKASVTKNGDTMNSDRITYDRVHHKIKAGAAASGKQRVQITIQPPKK